MQRAPELLSYIQTIVDARRTPGMFILTRSSQFELGHQVSQSLAGRTALVTLLPFAFEELYHDRAQVPSIDQILYQGFYPPIHDRQLNPSEALQFYIATYVERDVRSLLNIKDLLQFETFLRLCAARTGQIPNLSALGADAGVTHNTARSWISVLEASYVLFRLPPHFRNFSKRLTKSPKLYFIDTGLACALLGIGNPGQVANHPQRGALFETLIVSEILKKRFNSVRQQNLYYFHETDKREVDLVLDYGNHVVPIEIKSGSTVAVDFTDGLDYYQRLSGESSQKPCLIYGGAESYIHKNTQILSYKDLGSFETASC